MAQNYVAPGKHIIAACSHPAVPASGDPVRLGTICGVAMTKEGEGGNASTEATVCLQGIFNLSVKGVDQSANSAVAVGDKIYYTDADTPVLGKKNTGVFFGVALGTVTSGGTATIPVLLHW